MLRLIAVLGCLAAMVLPASVRAQSVEDFYRGKQITIVVGYGPGGGYDLVARILSRHMSKHLPGNPTIVVQNMPGAGSMRAANYLFNVAPKDGTTFGIFARNIPLTGILGGNSAVQFDPMKFTYLGSSSSYEEDAYVLFLRRDAAVKSIEDATKPGGPEMVLGGTGEGSTGNDIPILLRDALGLNLKLITGYPDAAALFLAIDRGEIQGRITDFSSVKANKPEFVGPNGLNMLLQFARRTRHPELPNVPTARELAKTDRAKALIELAELPFYMSRPFAAPPGVPEDRTKALRKAFMDAHKDPELIAEATKLKMGVTPVAGEDFYPLIEKLGKMPPDLLDYIRKLQDANKG